MAGPRSRARDVALQVLCLMDGEPDMTADAALRLYDDMRAEDEEPAVEFDRALAEALVRAVAAHRDDIDRALGEASKKWRLERMARVDRNVLRLALGELLHVPGVPVEVTLDEAIELARRFGADEAPAFVNGILDGAVKTLGIVKPEPPGSGGVGVG